MKKINLSFADLSKLNDSRTVKLDKLREAENRKHPRADLAVKVTLYPVSESTTGLEVPDQGFEATTFDISESGIRIELNDTDSLADILKVELKINQKRLIELFAKLVWQKGNNCGFQSIVLSHEDLAEIKDYVEKREKTNPVPYLRKKPGGRPFGSKNGGSVSWEK